MCIGQCICCLCWEVKKMLLEVVIEVNLLVGFLLQVECYLMGILLLLFVNVVKVLGVLFGMLIEQLCQVQFDLYEGSCKLYVFDVVLQWYEWLFIMFDGSQINVLKVQMMEGYWLEWVVYGGDEFVYVLVGCICYMVGKKNYLLMFGDLLYFDVCKWYCVVNVGDGLVELIIVSMLLLFDDSGVEFVFVMMEIR